MHQRIDVRTAIESLKQIERFSGDRPEERKVGWEKLEVRLRDSLPSRLIPYVFDDEELTMIPSEAEVVGLKSITTSVLCTFTGLARLKAEGVKRQGDARDVTRIVQRVRDWSLEQSQLMHVQMIKQLLSLTQQNDSSVGKLMERVRSLLRSLPQRIEPETGAISLIASSLGSEYKEAQNKALACGTLDQLENLLGGIEAARAVRGEERPATHAILAIKAADDKSRNKRTYPPCRHCGKTCHQEHKCWQHPKRKGGEKARRHERQERYREERRTPDRKRFRTPEKERGRTPERERGRGMRAPTPFRRGYNTGYSLSTSRSRSSRSVSALTP